MSLHHKDITIATERQGQSKNCSYEPPAPPPKKKKDIYDIWSQTAMNQTITLAIT